MSAKWLKAQILWVGQFSSQGVPQSSVLALHLFAIFINDSGCESKSG